MIKQILLSAVSLSVLFAMTACGPEAETGVLFSRTVQVAQRAVAAGSMPDSISPAAAAPAGLPDLNYLMGKFDPAVRPDFVAVGRPYTQKPGMWLRRETYAAFQNMWAAAKKGGVDLTIISSTRTFEKQKNIWEGKWTRFAAETPDPEARALKILEYSAMPGVSRHHWGTDIDLNDLNNNSFEAGGRYEPAYKWLQQHAAEFGFCQPYSPKGTERPQGYNEEKWHWSYMPLATPLLQQYRQGVRDDSLTGFSGASLARQLQIVERYALGINPACR